MEVGVDTQSEIDSEMLKGRNTVAECYPYGLDDAENLIPAATAAKNKATKSAAIAFNKVYLHKEIGQM
jgi:hypothetical protein